MALNVNDPALKLLYGMDESGALSLRSNAAAQNDVYNYELFPQIDGVPNDGVPPGDDNRGGKGVNTARTADGLPSELRWLIAQSGSLDFGAQLLAGDFPDLSTMIPGQAFVLGMRFNWPGFVTNSSGGAASHYVCGMFRQPTEESDPSSVFGFRYQANTNTGTATGGAPSFQYGRASFSPTDFWDTVTGSPPADPITDTWQSVIVRVTKTADDIPSRCIATIKVWLTYEETGQQFTWEDSTQINYITQLDKDRLFEFAVGSRWDNRSNEGIVDQVFLYNGVLSDAEIDQVIRDGISIPWFSEPVTILPHDVRVGYANAQSMFPKPRQLPVGAPFTRHPAGNFGSRQRLYYEGFRAARPWTIRRAAMQFDTVGPRGSRADNEFPWDKINDGIIRLPGVMPSGSCEDARDMEFSGEAPRRRRGFRIRNAGDPLEGDNNINAFKRWRSYDDQLHGCLKIGTKLFAEVGGGALSELDTGWETFELPSFSILGNRLIISTPGRQMAWEGSTDLTSIYPLGQEAPTTGDVAATIGTLQPGTYIYAYTFWDPISGDETGPYVFDPVVLALNEGGILSNLDTISMDARFTYHKFYRSAIDLGTDTLALIDAVPLAASYTDGPISAPYGTDILDQTDFLYVQLVPPDTFGATTVHKQRLFGFQAQNKPERMFWGEPNEPLSWWPNSFTIHEAPIKAAMGIGDRVIVWTDRTTEILESDFIRDGQGNYQIRRTVISREVGCPGHGIPVDMKGIPVWMDWRAVYMLQGDKIQEISHPIRNIFGDINMGESDTFTGSFNHIRQQVWFTIAAAGDFQQDSSRHQTQIVFQQGGDERWSFYNLESTYCAQFDDDLNGQRYGLIDHLGVFKEAELFEADGLDDPADLALSEVDDGVLSVTGSTITVKGVPAWVDMSLRGMGVILRDEQTGAWVYSTISSNTADTFTIVGFPPSGYGLDDGYYIGGIGAYLQTSGQDFGTTNLKASRHLYSEFDVLTGGLLF